MGCMMIITRQYVNEAGMISSVSQNGLLSENIHMYYLQVNIGRTRKDGTIGLVGGRRSNQALKDSATQPLGLLMAEFRR